MNIKHCLACGLKNVMQKIRIADSINEETNEVEYVTYYRCSYCGVER